MSEPRVSIVILNWNQKDDTAKCLKSLEKLTYTNYGIIVVDNGSKDDSAGFLKNNFSNITLIENSENLGFAEGCNIGIRHALSAGTDYVLLLNNDLIVQEDLLRILVETAEKDGKIGILGAVNYAQEKPEKLIIVGTNFNWWTGFTRKEDLKSVENGKVKGPQVIQGVTGSALFIKREVIDKIGLLDSRYFIYYEDTDWCMRAGKAGYKVAYVASAKTWHKMSASFGEKTDTEIYLYSRNLPLFMIKNCPKIFLPSFFLFYALKNVIYFINFILIGENGHARALLLGVFDFCRKNFGKGRLDYFISRKRRA